MCIRKPCLVPVLVLAAALAAARAGEPTPLPPPPPLPLPAEPAPPPPVSEGKQRLEEVVVTASRLEEEQRRSGSSVSVVTGRELETHRPSLIWEELRLTPGVSFVQSGTLGQQTAMFTRGGESDHTTVLLDGFKLNDDGGDFPWETLHPAGAGRVEVLRGAGSALYGADAMTGAVQVLTARGQGPPELTLSSEAGTYRTFRQRAGLTGQDGPMAYNLSLSRLDVTGGRFPNADLASTSFTGRLDWTTAGGVNLKLLQYSVGDEVGNYKTDLRLDPDAKVEHRRSLTGLEVSGRAFDLVDSRLLLGRSNVRFSFDDAIDDPDTNDWQNYNTNKNLDRLSADWQNSAQLYELGPAAGTLVAGLAWEEELGRIDATSDGGNLPPLFGGTPLDPSANHVDRSRSARSVYAEKRLELWEALSLTAGARTEDHSTFGTKTATRLAAGLWLEATGTRLHCSWGQGFKSPTFDENYDNSFYSITGGSTLVVGDPDLRPELVTSMDAGIEQHLLDDAVVAGATVFRNRFKDFIVFDMAISSWRNARRAEAEGIEYELALKPADWLRARGSLTVTHTMAITDEDSINFQDGRPLIRRPDRVACGLVEIDPLEPWAGLPDWSRRLTLFGEVVHQAETEDVDWGLHWWDSAERVDLEPFTAANAGASWEFLKGPRHSLRLFGRWDNVGDVEYETSAGISGPKSAFLGGLGLAVRF